MVERRCGKCRIIKSISDFCKNKSRKLGIHNECKACQVEYNRKWALVSKYKITFQEATSLIESVTKGCQICGVALVLKKEGYAIDHCHKTNKIRGILCRNCNHGLGNFRDNVSTMKSAIKYLRKYS